MARIGGVLRSLARISDPEQRLAAFGAELKKPLGELASVGDKYSQRPDLRRINRSVRLLNVVGADIAFPPGARADAIEGAERLGMEAISVSRGQHSDFDKVSADLLRKIDSWSALSPKSQVERLRAEQAELDKFRDMARREIADIS